MLMTYNPSEEVDQPWQVGDVDICAAKMEVIGVPAGMLSKLLDIFTDPRSDIGPVVGPSLHARPEQQRRRSGLPRHWWRRPAARGAML